MSTFIFHNKYHRNAHHTVPTSGYPDSASDPIASEKDPFMGIFHNNLTGGLSSNSFDWSSMYTLVSSNSAVWDRYLSLFTTVSENSGFWENNASLYTSYNSISSNLDSAYTTVSVNSATWNKVYLETALYTNESQEDTRQKTFAILEIEPNDINDIVLDLSGGQVSYYTISDTSNISGFDGSKKGGKYHFYVITNGTCNSAIKINFNPDYFKFNSTNSFEITGSWLRKFEFVSDGNILHGKTTLFDANLIDDRDTYFQGNGIILNPNPAFITDGDALNPLDGISINGVYPYTAGIGIIINNTIYSSNFSFVFNTTNTQSAVAPYGDLGSEDRINLFNPVLTAINARVLDNVVSLKRCDYYGGIDVVTRAYGYISEMILDNSEIKNFDLRVEGYQNHETGHRLTSDLFPITASHTLFVRFGNPIPLTLSAGMSLWLDAMDYSSVEFDPNNNFITGLSSKLTNTLVFSSLSSSEIFYNILGKQSFNYNLSSTHYRELLLSGDGDFVTLSVFTPVASSSDIQWLWNNGGYGVFKIPNSYSVGIGNLSSFYTYFYGAENVNRAISVGTLYLSSNNTQSIWLNGPLTNIGLPITANFTTGYTMIGGLDPLTGFSNFKLHENILYSGAKSITDMNSLNFYLTDKWKFL